jgi:hypothetical protein
MLRTGTIGAESAYLAPVTKVSKVSFTKWRGFVMNRTMAVGFLILIVGHVGVATAQDRKFVDKLVESRLQLKIDGERMTGGGADLLRSALDGRFKLRVCDPRNAWWTRLRLRRGNPGRVMSRCEGQSDVHQLRLPCWSATKSLGDRQIRA